jgi:hypothetical protein
MVVLGAVVNIMLAAGDVAGDAELVAKRFDSLGKMRELAEVSGRERLVQRTTAYLRFR